MSMLALIGSPVAVAALGVSAYSVYLKLREAPVPGVNVNTRRSQIVTNGEAEADVLIRAMGAAVRYEARARVWGAGNVLFKTPHHLPKMTCESDPIEVAISYPADAVTAPWVGLTWFEHYGRSVREYAVRVNMRTEEYQVWRWRNRNRLLRFGRPAGYWFTPRATADGGLQLVERDEAMGAGVSVDPESVEPHDVWK
ncbi:hypothetical protein SAMN05421776_108202 [Nocardia farcinica]|uniref:Uncharacterized protein n=1 Tax=Nocardia farcinica TaxID=37329 RepID=A0A0H5NEH6_NOCFR|nr:hypothetical protein [Nocardia farcinica]MBA4858089.1 hypothetical protein [Nocardia farcinica]MBC9819380.1 hypothetical protein [Nocardia farcinica]PFX04074.1 hypothetical protein CJ469_01948 [Nocardia farcinica]PFX10232.1 hypothetical protein CJ468_01079 [Nocardia farcinica]CRY73552.1 Uncharacterised protein [Nocardia farcinica]